MDVSEQTEISVLRRCRVVIRRIVIGAQLCTNANVIGNCVLHTGMKHTSYGSVPDFFAGLNLLSLGLISAYINSKVQEEILLQKTLGGAVD